MSDPKAINMNGYISRDVAVATLLEWADKNANMRHNSPAFTARRCAEIIAAQPSMDGEVIVRGPIRQEFTGLNITFGKCSRCGHKLIWYTEDPVKGCPYCFMRKRREVKANVANPDAVRKVQKRSGGQPVQSATSDTNGEEDQL